MQIVRRWAWTTMARAGRRGIRADHDRAARCRTCSRPPPQCDTSDEPARRRARPIPPEQARDHHRVLPDRRRASRAISRFAVVPMIHQDLRRIACPYWGVLLPDQRLYDELRVLLRSRPQRRRSRGANSTSPPPASSSSRTPRSSPRSSSPGCSSGSRGSRFGARKTNFGNVTSPLAPATASCILRDSRKRQPRRPRSPQSPWEVECVVQRQASSD